MSLFLTVTEHANQAKETLYEINTDRYDGWVPLGHPDAHVALIRPFPSQCCSLPVCPSLLLVVMGENQK